jgi:predicted Zn-dependent protease
LKTELRVCTSTAAANRLQPLDPKTKLGALNKEQKLPLLFVFVERLPKPFDDAKGRQIVEDAFRSWMATSDVIIRLVDQGEEANVVVTTADDRDGTSLGHADVGGPELLRANRLTIRLNGNDKWTAESLFATLIHHVGHVLGLEHTTKSGEAMYSLLNTQRPLTQIGKEDQSRMTVLWGQSSTKQFSRP